MSFRDDLIGGIRSAACTYIQGVGAANDWLQSIIPTTPNPPFEAGLNGLLCDDPTPPPQTPPPFTGGQCPEVLYNVSWAYQIEGNPETTGVLNGVRGPVGVENVDTPPPSPGKQGRILQRVGTPSELGFLIFSTSEEVTSGLSITAIVRADGLPDDCGDPEVIIPPFTPPTITVPVPDPGGGPDIDVDVTLFAPVIIGPNVFAPVRIEGPNFDIDGRINFQPNFNIEVGIGGTGGGGGTTVPPEPEDDFDPESPDEPPAADGRRIIGLIVTLNTDSIVRATELAQDGDIGSILVPRIAIAYLISNNGGVRVPLSGVDLKLRNTYIPVPPDVEVVSWRIHTEPGVTVQSVRPVYGTTRPGA